MSGTELPENTRDDTTSQQVHSSPSNLSINWFILVVAGLVFALGYHYSQQAWHFITVRALLVLGGWLLLASLHSPLWNLGGKIGAWLLRHNQKLNGPGRIILVLGFILSAVPIRFLLDSPDQEITMVVLAWISGTLLVILASHMLLPLCVSPLRWIYRMKWWLGIPLTFLIMLVCVRQIWVGHRVAWLNYLIEHGTVRFSDGSFILRKREKQRRERYDHQFVKTATSQTITNYEGIVGAGSEPALAALGHLNQLQTVSLIVSETQPLQALPPLAKSVRGLAVQYRGGSDKVPSLNDCLQALDSNRHLLVHLEWISNSLEGQDLQRLERFDNLHQLLLQGQHSIALSRFSKIKSLRQLTLYNTVSVDDLASDFTFPKLEHLDIEWLHHGDDELAAFNKKKFPVLNNLKLTALAPGKHLDASVLFREHPELSVSLTPDFRIDAADYQALATIIDRPRIAGYQSCLRISGTPKATGSAGAANQLANNLLASKHKVELQIVMDVADLKTPETINVLANVTHIKLTLTDHANSDRVLNLSAIMSMPRWHWLELESAVPLELDDASQTALANRRNLTGLSLRGIRAPDLLSTLDGENLRGIGVNDAEQANLAIRRHAELAQSYLLNFGDYMPQQEQFVKNTRVDFISGGKSFNYRNGKITEGETGINWWWVRKYHYR